MKDTNQRDIIALNENTSVKYTPGTVSTTAGRTDVLETGKSLFIKLEKPYKVYINDTLKGTAPLLINDLREGEAFLRIESDDEYHGIKLKVTMDRTDIVTYTPVMGKYKGNLFVESTPKGAGVFIDGKKLGETPGAFSDLVADKHKLVIKTIGYQPHEQEINIPRKDTLRISAELEKAYLITFQNPLPENTQIKAAKDKSTLEFTEKESIWLVCGKWEFVISNKAFKTVTLNYEITDNKKISFAPEYYRSRIVFENLDQESKVLLDNRDITDKLQDNAYETRVGSYEIRIKTDSYKDYCEKIELEKDRDHPVQITYEISPVISGRKNAWIGYPLLGAGALMAITGFVINLDDIAVALSGNDNSYTAIKWTSFGSMCAGLAAVTVGTVFVIKSIGNFKEAKTETEIWNGADVSIDIRDNAPVLLLQIPLKP